LSTEAIAAIRGAKNIIIPSHGSLYVNDVIVIPQGMTINTTSVIGTSTRMIIDGIYTEYLEYLYWGGLSVNKIIKKKDLGFFQNLIEKVKGFKLFANLLKRDLPWASGKTDLNYPIGYNIVYSPDLTTRFTPGNMIPEVILCTDKKKTQTWETNITLRIINQEKWHYTDIIFTDDSNKNQRLSNLLDDISRLNNNVNIFMLSCLPFRVIREEHDKYPIWTKCLDYLSPRFRIESKERHISSFFIDIQHALRKAKHDIRKRKNIFKKSPDIELSQLAKIEAQFLNIDFEKFVWNFLRLFPKTNTHEWYILFRKKMETYDPKKIFMFGEKEEHFFPCIIILLWNYRVGHGKYLLFNVPKMLVDLTSDPKIIDIIEILQEVLNKRAQPSNCKEIIKKRNKLIADIKYG